MSYQNFLRILLSCFLGMQREAFGCHDWSEERVPKLHKKHRVKFSTAQLDVLGLFYLKILKVIF